MRKTPILMALMILTGCDYIRQRQDLVNEREDSLYRSALADYQSGRLDAAVKGFAKTIRRSPGNAAARFQYACLMQDSKKNFLEAFCAYREYLNQHPESDKSSIARDRLARCERELARELAVKYDLGGTDAFAKEIERLRADLKGAETRTASAEKLLEEERARYRTLEGEHTRLVSVVKNTEVGGEKEKKKSVELKDLLDEEAEETKPAVSSTFDEIAKLKTEEKDETSAGTSLLPSHTEADVAKRDAAKIQKAADERAAAEKTAAERAKRPATYVIQEGDTLYKIALRFYGSIKAWRSIRDANRTQISNDGRVRAGQTITLP